MASPSTRVTPLTAAKRRNCRADRCGPAGRRTSSGGRVRRGHRDQRGHELRHDRADAEHARRAAGTARGRGRSRSSRRRRRRSSPCRGPASRRAASPGGVRPAQLALYRAREGSRRWTARGERRPRPLTSRPPCRPPWTPAPAAGRRHGRRRSARPDDAPGRRRARPVPARAGRRPVESAALVAADVRIGDHRELAELRRLAEGATVVTFDHEHVPTAHLAALEADGHRVAPGPEALVHAQDKLVLRAALTDAGEPQPAWAGQREVGDVEAFAATAAGRSSSRPRAAGTTGVACSSSQGRRRTPSWSTARRAARRAAGEMPASSPPRWRGRLRPGGRVAGRRDGAARWHLHRGARPGAGAARRAGHRCPGARRAGSRTASASSG